MASLSQSLHNLVRSSDRDDADSATVFTMSRSQLLHPQDHVQRMNKEFTRKTFAPPYLETTARKGQATQALSGPVSDTLQDLTNQLQGKSNHPVTSGGFGDIWKCNLVKLNGIVQVAVKIIRAFESDNDALVWRNTKRVRRELKIWGRLKHECILPLWGVAGTFGPYPAMICPWVDNGALTGFLERQQDILSCQDKFSLLSDIADGLQYLHSKSIVHGDLTGSNVLVHGNGRACLADFGLSTMVLEFMGTSYLTSSIRGNIRWAAAELFEVPEDEEDDGATVLLSAECDIYSFGSITLQVLTCKVPYYNVKKDHVVLGQVIRGKKPEPPKESQIASPHWELIQRCWLPRAERPSVEEIVTFVASERGAGLAAAAAGRGSSKRRRPESFVSPDGAEVSWSYPIGDSDPFLEADGFGDDTIMNRELKEEQQVVVPLSIPNAARVRGGSSDMSNATAIYVSSHETRPTAQPVMMVRPVASQALLNANQKRRRQEAAHRCDECGQTFTAIFSLRRHVQSHFGIRPFTCSIPGCGQAFFNQSDCRRHERSKKRHNQFYTLIPDR